MARILPTLLVLALLGCTAAAFAVTEGLKLEKSPIGGTKVGKTLAPVCGCDRDQLPIAFFLRKRDRVTVAIVNGNGEVVRTLSTRNARRGTQQFIWNGRGSSGRLVADGIYRPRVHLAREHRTIVLPNSIRVDQTAPLIRLDSVSPRVFSPDGDFRREFVRLHYRTSEKARAVLYLNGDRRTLTKRYVRAGKLDWGGRAARKLAAGTYRVQLRAIDLAGNLSKPTRAFVVRVRYIEVRPHVLQAKSGARIGFRIVTDAQRYSWHFGSVHRIGHGSPLVFSAGPPGLYVLRVAANGHVARAVVTVTP